MWNRARFFAEARTVAAGLATGFAALLERAGLFVFMARDFWKNGDSRRVSCIQ